MYLLKDFSDLQSEVICSRGWEAGENVLITWFSLADKQDKLYKVYAVQALTNQRVYFICVVQSEYSNLAPL